MMTAAADPATEGAHWLALPDSALERLQEEAWWLYCQDQANPTQALRHLMNMVLLEQIDALRDAVRSGLLPARLAEAGMLSAFADGYLAGLVASYAEACDLPPDSPHLHAARRDVLGTVHGWTRSLAGQPWRSSGTEATVGMAVARADTRDFKAWLQGARVRTGQGLRNGLLRWARALGDAGVAPH
jgi:hypothetical protein